METYPKSHLKAAAVIGIAFAIIFAALPSRESPRMTRVPVSLSITESETRTPEPAAEAEVAVDDLDIDLEPTHLVSYKIRVGDNLSSLFARAGLTAQELHGIMSLGPEVAQLRRIMPGKSLEIELNPQGEFVSLRYEEDQMNALVVKKSGDEYVVVQDVSKPEVLISYATATISDAAPSLYQAGKAAGLSDNVIMKLSYIFQWDISFALDLRQGDSFALMYEDIYVEGDKVKEGDIVAAQFTNMGKTYTAVLYDDGNGHKNYFAPDGSSMRKAFLRDPVHFKYVSSKFDLHRLHPIHNRVMPHRGIDYAAKKGTPVLASGDGKVTIARNNSASGNYIVIQHGEQYTTKYLHLSAFAKGIRPGRSVKQGQVIGYVGATGWATAPHLHYEFLVNGVHRNPRTVELPQADPIAKPEFPKFAAATAPLLTKLSSIVGDTSYAYATQAGEGGK